MKAATQPTTVQPKNRQMTKIGIVFRQPRASATNHGIRLNTTPSAKISSRNDRPTRAPAASASISTSNRSERSNKALDGVEERSICRGPDVTDPVHFAAGRLKGDGAR